MKKNEYVSLQIKITKAEHDKLLKDASDSKEKITSYIRKRLGLNPMYTRENDDFKDSLEELINRVNAYPSGSAFNIPLLLADRWDDKKIQSVKGILGKTFYRMVKSGEISGIIAIGKRNNVMTYMKK